MIKVSLGIPITFIIIVAFLVLLPFYVDPVVIGMALLITAAGIPVYLVGVVWKNKPTWLIKIFGDFNFFTFFSIQKASLNRITLGRILQKTSKINKWMNLNVQYIWKRDLGLVIGGWSLILYLCVLRNLVLIAIGREGNCPNCYCHNLYLQVTTIQRDVTEIPTESRIF